MTIFLAGIASLSGYDDFDAVTAEDMAMEVTLQIFKATQKINKTPVLPAVKFSYMTQGLPLP